MVKAIININQDTNKILNIIKAKYGLKDKSQAIDKITEEYGEKILEIELRPKVLDSLKGPERNNIPMAPFGKGKEVKE